MVDGDEWLGERVPKESVLAILREQVCSRLVGLRRAGGVEDLDGDPADFLELVEDGNNAEDPKEDAAEDETKGGEEAGAQWLRQKQVVNGHRVPATEAEGEVEAESGPGDELHRFVEPE